MKKIFLGLILAAFVSMPAYAEEVTLRAISAWQVQAGNAHTPIGLKPANP